jgi:hypothetical protein
MRCDIQPIVFEGVRHYFWLRGLVIMHVCMIYNIYNRRGRLFGSSYRCSSFGGRCAYIHHLFQRMLLSCGVWSVYVSPIACASWIERVNVWEERGFTSTSLLHLHKSLFVLFSVLCLGQVIFPLFYGCLCVCCVYVCVCVVWWGSSLFLSGSLRGWS